MELEYLPTKHEVLSLTGEALNGNSDDRVTRLVQLIRGYQALFEVCPERRDYLEDVAYHLLALAQIVSALGREDLGNRLRHVVNAIGCAATTVTAPPEGTDFQNEIDQVFSRLRAAYRKRVERVVECGRVQPATVQKA